jgi:hypothetical protein
MARISADISSTDSIYIYELYVLDSDGRCRNANAGFSYLNADAPPMAITIKRYKNG